ncbi:MAG: rhodanese-like domain-containing protein [Proteobacteria bacterium]|nr:rhodanese-like domain-containing protein [Pseudomonadota bacterium]
MSGWRFVITRLFFLFICILSVFASISYVHAEDKDKIKQEAPMNLTGAKTITAVDVINLIDELPQTIIIDSRLNDRPQGYIEGSINLADIDTTCNSLADIIKTLSSPVIFYCNGVKCRRSEKAVKVAVSCGYNHIYWYRSGCEDWIKQGYPYLTN